MKPPKLVVKLYLAYRFTIPKKELKKQIHDQLATLQNKLSSLSPEQLESRKTTEGWNGMQIAFHTLLATRRMLRIADELRNDREVPNLDQSVVGKTNDVSYKDLMEYFGKVQTQVEGFDFSGLSKRKCRHPILGNLNWKQWVVVSLIHMERHYRQLIRTVV